MTVNSITEGFNLQQEVWRGVQEALKDYLPPNQLPTESADIPIGAVTPAHYRQPCPPR